MPLGITATRILLCGSKLPYETATWAINSVVCLFPRALSRLHDLNISRWNLGNERVYGLQNLNSMTWMSLLCAACSSGLLHV